MYSVSDNGVYTGRLARIKTIVRTELSNKPGFCNVFTYFLDMRARLEIGR